MSESDPTVVDWDDLSGWIARLDDTKRSILTHALRQAESASRQQAIVDNVRDVLAREAPGRDAVAVVFSASEWDNGYFLRPTGLVLFADYESTDEIEFDHVDEIFTDEYGSGGSDLGLAVNLRTGDVEVDDYIDNLYEQHGFPTKR